MIVVSGQDNWAECRVGLMIVLSGQDNLTVLGQHSDSSVRKG